MRLDLEEFETRIELRPLVQAELDALVALQLACFPGMATWKRAELQSQLRYWELAQVGVFVDGDREI